MMRVRLETDAVYLILEHVQQANYDLIVSPTHLIEIGATTHEREDAELLLFLETFGMRPSWNLVEARKRAEELCQLKFGPADAAHIAFAEQAADVFITCDDPLLKKCRKVGTNTVTMGPVEFCANEGLK